MSGRPLVQNEPPHNAFPGERFKRPIDRCAADSRAALSNRLHHLFGAHVFAGIRLQCSEDCCTLTRRISNGHSQNLLLSSVSFKKL